MIDELPYLPFGLIWRELSYGDRFNLRRTCKRLTAICFASSDAIHFAKISSIPTSWSTMRTLVEFRIPIVSF